MRRQKYEQVEWLEFELLADFPRVKHAVFLRHGGCSEGPFASLNTGFHVGDSEENVKKNLQLIQHQLRREIPQWKHIIWGRACHGKVVTAVNETSPHEILGADGVMTSTPGLSLLMKHADCQVALFYDPKHHVGATVHCGWRGSVANIYAETVQQMRHTYGSQPADLFVCISPSLGPDEAEFMHYRAELPEEFWHFQVRPTYFDFWSISEHQLQTEGILPHHIEVARLSTYSNSYDYFSYRRDKTTGRHATCLTLL
jgi:YfiH family protein